MKPLIQWFAASPTMSGGLGLAGLTLAARSAQATPGPVPLTQWCPGDPPQKLPRGFDQTVCHDYYWSGPDATHSSSYPVEGVFQPPMCGPVPCGMFP